MPVQKFKTFEEAEKSIVKCLPGETYFERVAELWAFADKLNHVFYPRGIFKFHTIEEANKHREDLELAHAKEKQEKKLL